MKEEYKYKTKKYYVHFNELGDYDNLDYWFNTYQEAEDKLFELRKEHKTYFGFIAEVLKAVRKDV